MDLLEIETSAGVFGLVGRVSAAQAKPCLLMVAGAFPTPDAHHELVSAFKDANVLIVRLPGWGVPLSDASARQLTFGLQEAMTLLFRDLPIVVCGLSASAMVTLPLKAPNIHRKVILEPFLRTARLWPLINHARRVMAKHPEDSPLQQYLWNILGIGGTTLEDRDYRYVVEDIDVPTAVVVGGLPLMPERDLPLFPSLTSEEDRDLLRAHPLVTLFEGPAEAGHNLWIDPAASRTIHGLLGDYLMSARELLGRPLSSVTR
jgi:hypothetical protein